MENTILSGLGPRALWFNFGYLLLSLTPAGLAVSRAVCALSLTYKSLYFRRKKEDAEHFRTGLFSGRKITVAKRIYGFSSWEEMKQRGETQHQANRIGSALGDAALCQTPRRCWKAQDCSCRAHGLARVIQGGCWQGEPTDLTLPLSSLGTLIISA